MNGIQHVDQSVRSVCIVHNGSNAFGRADRVEPSGYRVQSAESYEDIFFFLAQQYGCAEYGEKIVGIELADETYGQLTIVEVKQHAFKMRLQYLTLEVTQAS